MIEHWIPFLCSLAMVCAGIGMQAFAADDKDVFTAELFEDGSKTLLYRQLQPPHIEAGKRYPLVIFLHGAGERGQDNTQQLKHFVRIFADENTRTEYPCFVIAPQCPKNKRWCEVDWSDPKPHTTPKEPSEPMNLLLALLEQLRQQPNIDQSRIYVAGASMGGFGTWDLLARRPHLIAAAIPICGGADLSTAKELANTPIWVFHGSKDNVVKTVRSQLMVEELKKAGSTVVRYTEFKGVAHDAWTPASKEEELLPWLFGQRRTR